MLVHTYYWRTLGGKNVFLFANVVHVAATVCTCAHAIIFTRRKPMGRATKKNDLGACHGPLNLLFAPDIQAVVA